MSKKVYLFNLSNHIEELKLPTKGLKLRVEMENVIIAVEGTLFKGLYYAIKWLKRGLGWVSRGYGAPRLFGLLILAIIALLVSYGI